jgi:hypothetical protein
MSRLRWSQNQAGNWNGKRGPFTLFVVAFHKSRGWFVAPKLPGLKTVDVPNAEEGRFQSQFIWERYLNILISMECLSDL